MQALQLSLSRQQPIEDAVFRAAVGIAAPRKGCAATCFSPCAVRKPGQAGWRGGLGRSQAYGNGVSPWRTPRLEASCPDLWRRREKAVGSR
jgi:hypothetical protein